MVKTAGNLLNSDDGENWFSIQQFFFRFISTIPT